ncbi:hypothetical protein CFC21_103715 [Triticum aestivum]|uniref:Uncharacterized protein n=2 Tax=Triticum aestivum TaxID=4565 RepID=A0A3B6SHU2_WHEAT|nr:hypothetical protein CFC21_103715 [Triticum aestivum]
MASFARAARFMVLLQIALFAVSAVIMSSSVCYGAGISRECFRTAHFILFVVISSFSYTGALDPSRRPICRGRPCGQPGLPYGGRPRPYPYRPQPGPGAPPPYNGGIGRP